MELSPPKVYILLGSKLQHARLADLPWNTLSGNNNAFFKHCDGCRVRISVSRYMSDNTIHAYTIDLEATPEEIDYCKRILSPQETAHARSFASPVQRKQWILGRGILRMLLAEHYGDGFNGLDQHPVDLKPAQQTRICGNTGEYFSMSFSDKFALLTVTENHRIGNNIERIQPIHDFGGILQILFSPHEQAEFMGLKREDRIDAFYTSWTAKEALLKALGNSTEIGSKDFDVAINPKMEANLINIRHATERAEDWTLLTLAPQPNYVATIACETRTKLSLHSKVVTADMLIELAEEEMTLR